MSSPQSPNIFIIIVNWNGKKDTLECLSSVEKILYPSFQAIVVDNGSADGSVQAIRENFPYVSVLEAKENLGFAEGNNVGLRFALEKGADAIFLLNNDTTVDPHVLTNFVSSMEKEPHLGILGAKIYLYSQRQQLDHLGGFWNKQKGNFDLLGLREMDDGKKWEKMQQVDYVCGAALFAKREVFEAIGLLEPKFFLIWEESDFCFRAKRAGFLTMTCPQAKIWHKVSASFVGGKPHSAYFWWRNRLLWIERNCSKKEKFGLYLKILGPDILHMVKIHLLKTLQSKLPFSTQEKRAAREQKILKNKASLQGVRDYFFRRFGNGPSWIYGTKK